MLLGVGFLVSTFYNSIILEGRGTVLVDLISYMDIPSVFTIQGRVVYASHFMPW